MTTRIFIWPTAAVAIHDRIQARRVDIPPAMMETKAVTKPAGSIAMSSTKQGMFPRTMQRPNTPQWWSKPFTQREHTTQW
mmetsp:Transcript_139897/g.447448  ORF Transcript_139897/g.447448 Transcript_139897/m.447448 type:complete len:80 (+) Transcript_139897:82-321(+)